MCVFLGVGRKAPFLISMTTSKQGSGLDTALPAGFLPCNVQHTHAHKHTNKLFTNKAELWQAGKEKAAMLQWLLLLFLSLMFFTLFGRPPVTLSLSLCLYPSYKHNMTDDLMRLTLANGASVCVCVYGGGGDGGYMCAYSMCQHMHVSVSRCKTE